MTKKLNGKKRTKERGTSTKSGKTKDKNRGGLQKKKDTIVTIPTSTFREFNLNIHKLEGKRKSNGTS